MNNKFLNEAINLEKKWNSDLLKGIDFTRRQTSVLMECQRLLNERPEYYNLYNYWRLKLTQEQISDKDLRKYIILILAEQELNKPPKSLEKLKEICNTLKYTDYQEPAPI